MRRVGVVAIMAAPWLAWLLVRLYVGSHVDQWAMAPSELPLTVRLALFADNWAIRMNPFLVIGAVVLSPLITLVIIWSVARASDVAAKLTPRWLLISAGCLAAPTVVATMSGAMTTRPSIQAGVTLMVLTVAALAASYASYAVGLGAALAWQRERVSQGYSAVSPRRALWVALVLQYFSVLALLVPLTIWYRGRSDITRRRSAA